MPSRAAQRIVKEPKRRGNLDRSDIVAAVEKVLAEREDGDSTARTRTHTTLRRRARKKAAKKKASKK